jgi:DNA sulfur modification protein DndD
MILQTVVLKNFMCYYGENEFQFTEGLNVVIGDNGYGKSKVYDAIYWVMFDKCFDTGAEEFRPTRLLNNKLVSDRAVHEADDGLVECSVSLTFYDSRKEDTYTLERSLKGTKKDGEINFGTVSKLKVTKKTALLSGKIIDDKEQIERIKRKILPDNIKPYMWFQGEQIDNIIDFKNSETLTQAINVLSDITKFDNISSIAESLYTSAKKELRKKQKALSKDEKQSDELDDQIDRKKSRLTDYKLQLKNSKKDSKKAQDRIDDLLSKLDVAEKIRELDSKRTNIEEKFNDLVLLPVNSLSIFPHTST